MDSIRLKIRTILEKQFILEAKLTSHLVDDRFVNRFLTPGLKSVGYEIPGARGEYNVIGKKELTQDQIKEIQNRINIIEKYNFPKNKSYAIKLFDLIINPQTVLYNSNSDMLDSKGKTLVYVDKDSNSNGNVVYVIIRNNEATTIMFSKSYSNINTEKFKVDAIIKDFNNITLGKIR